MNKWCLLFFLIPAVAHAKFYPPQGPFTIRTQNPVYLQTVNLSPTRAEVLPPHHFEFRVDSAFSNLYERQTSNIADVNLDMEWWQLNWVGTYGALPDFEVGLEIPLIHFGSGLLDSFIQNYHDFFGFPNGGRDQVANSVFNYKVSKDGRLVYQVSSQQAGLGDITLFGKHQFWDENDLWPALAWRFGVKLPSGNSTKGLGSGNFGFGLGLALEKSYQRLHGFLNLNYLVDGGNDSLVGLMENNVFDFSLAGEFSFSKRVSGIIQLVGGTPRLKGTGLGEWNGMPLDFIVGARGDLKNFFWQAALSEDIRAKGPSVDVTFWTSLGVRFPFWKGRPYQGDFFGRVRKEYLPHPPQPLVFQ